MWVILGDSKNNKLYGLKRVSFPKQLKVQIKFIAPSEGDHDLQIFLISDSWVGCDNVKFIFIKSNHDRLKN